MSVKTHNKTKLVPVNRSVARLPEREAKVSPILECIDLGVTFGGLKAVDNFDITIGRTEIAGLIGPNGAGKTTIFNLLTNVYKPTRGSILLDGVSTAGKSTIEVNHMGIARTFQNIRLFRSLTVFDNVLIAKHMRAKQNVFTATLRLNAKEEKRMRDEAMALLKEQHLEHLKDDIAGSLPYGLQRRLEIARALATDPKLLLLDEPAAGMNPQETKELTEFISQIRHEYNIPILMIEHHMDLVMAIAERIYVLDFGRLIASGTAAEGQDNPDVINAYLGVDEDE